MCCFYTKIQIGIFDGGPNLFSNDAYYVFYYPDADTANEKWSKLVALVEQDGLHGNQLTQFIRDGNPREQGFNGIGFEREWAKCFKEMTR
jgi:hypothetical protein